MGPQFRRVLTKWIPSLSLMRKRRKGVVDTQSILEEYGAKCNNLLENELIVNET